METLGERYVRIKEERAQNPPPQEPSYNMFSDIKAMLAGSELVYAFATLRIKAMEKDLEKEHLIGISPGNKEERQKILSEGIKDKITIENIVEFIEANLKTLEDDKAINPDNILIDVLLDMSMIKNAYIAKFDAKNSGHAFVYGIYVNHDRKRISLSFRGTSATRDWLANASVLKSELDPSASLVKLGFDENKKIYVHGGFKAYLMGDRKKAENIDTGKYKDIKDELVELYTSGECDGYELIVTGHSLGGALSTLMAFNLASSSKIRKILGNKPVVNISFASPYVGGKVFSEAFKILEKAGRIQHIRVSNETDVVPVAIIAPNYMHVGINLHLDPVKDVILVYQGKRSFNSQFSPFQNAANHSLDEYDTRFRKAKDQIESMAINDIYSNSSITKDFAE